MKIPAHYPNGDLIPSAAANHIIRSAFAVGFDANPVLRKAEIHFDKSQNRITTDLLIKDQFSAIYRECIVAISNHQVYSRSNQKGATFEEGELYCSCIVNCDNLEHAIIRSIRFFDALNDRSGKLHLEVAGRKASLTMSTGSGENSPEALLCDYFGISFFYKFFCWLIAESLEDVEFTFAHKEFYDTDFMQEFLSHDLKFNETSNTIKFDVDALKKPIVRTNTEMMSILRESPFELTPPPTSKKLSVILEGIIRRSLNEKHLMPSADHVASRLNKSSPTLRRHLAHENTSYQEIADKCRKEKAIQLLSSQELTIDDISYWLGYSAPSGFSRAFKSWTGLAPSDFRQKPIEQK